MFEEILDLAPLGHEIFDVLYKYFYRDFITEKTLLNKSIYIDPQSGKKVDGKEASFWHLTTRKQIHTVKVGNRSIPKEERLPDYPRAERIEWIKEIITNHNHAEIKLFYHIESNEKKDLRLYLWAHRYDFVVILQKLGKSASFLVTSFYIDSERKKGIYEQRFQHYQNGNSAELANCEWF